MINKRITVFSIRTKEIHYLADSMVHKNMILLLRIEKLIIKNAIIQDNSLLKKKTLHHNKLLRYINNLVRL